LPRWLFAKAPTQIEKTQEHSVSQTLEEIASVILELRTELAEIRETYKGVSKSYTVALSALSDLTVHSADAAKRAAKSTEQSKIAAMNAMLAAKEASADPNLLKVVEAAVSAAIAAALAAVESAAAAAAASAAACAAVAHQAEASLLKASAEAATASRLAAYSAAEAVQLSHQAQRVVDHAHKQALLQKP
jgi:hypothetical protein